MSLAHEGRTAREPFAAAVQWLAARDWAAWAAFGLPLALAGVAFSMLGMAELHTSKRDLSAHQAAAAATGHPVVTDLPWLPSALAGYYGTHEVYVVDDEHDLRQWLLEVGDDVREFVFVSFSSPGPVALERGDGTVDTLQIEHQAFVRGLLFTELRVAP